MAFERKHQPLEPPHHFILRMARSSAWGVAFIAVSLFVGMLGFNLTEHMSWKTHATN